MPERIGVSYHSSLFYYSCYYVNTFYSTYPILLSTLLMRSRLAHVCHKTQHCLLVGLVDFHACLCNKHMKPMINVIRWFDDCMCPMIGCSVSVYIIILFAKRLLIGHWMSASSPAIEMFEFLFVSMSQIRRRSINCICYCWESRENVSCTTIQVGYFQQFIVIK